MQKRIDDKCKCKSSTGSTHVECCNICGLPLPKETWHFILSDHDISRVGAVVMPNEVVAGGKKLNLNEMEDKIMKACIFKAEHREFCIEIIREIFNDSQREA